MTQHLHLVASLRQRRQGAWRANSETGLNARFLFFKTRSPVEDREALISQPDQSLVRLFGFNFNHKRILKCILESIPFPFCFRGNDNCIDILSNLVASDDGFDVKKATHSQKRYEQIW